MTNNAVTKIQPHWWRKSFIGIFLGLSFAYSIVALFAWYGPGGIEADIKVQFNMWMISPIWLTIIAFTFMFKTAKQALLYLLSANIISYAVFFALRSTL